MGDGAHCSVSLEDVGLGRPRDALPAQVRLLEGRQGLERFEPPRTVIVAADRSRSLSFFLLLFGPSLLEVEPERGAWSDGPGRSRCEG